jgi:hypothetical protein
MRNSIILIIITAFSVILLTGCATVPPEFGSAMETERNGILLLHKRHQQTVQDLVENWYEERLARMTFIKTLELQKITQKFPDPEGGAPLEVIEKEALLKIERQFDEAVFLVNKTRLEITEGYLDVDNWDRLIKIHAVNLDMTRSLLELNKAQRRFYSELVGNNVPYPTDFINEKTKDMLDKKGFAN